MLALISRVVCSKLVSSDQQGGMFQACYVALISFITCFLALSICIYTRWTIMLVVLRLMSSSAISLLPHGLGMYIYTVHVFMLQWKMLLIDFSSEFTLVPCASGHSHVAQHLVKHKSLESGRGYEAMDTQTLSAHCAILAYSMRLYTCTWVCNSESKAKQMESLKTVSSFLRTEI